MVSPPLLGSASAAPHSPPPPQVDAFGFYPELAQSMVRRDPRNMASSSHVINNYFAYCTGVSLGGLKL